jgi:hypothetical protein
MTEAAAEIVRCDACPVLCRIRPGKVGACDRYANAGGTLVRVDPLVVTERTQAKVPFLDGAADWDGTLVASEPFVTGIGAGTTYPDYKPAPFIVGSQAAGVDMVTVVSEGIFSYCGLKVKIDTDRYLGPEQAAVRSEGEQIGHVTTAEYGSQMLSLGGVRHLTGGSSARARSPARRSWPCPTRRRSRSRSTAAPRSRFRPASRRWSTGCARSACGSAAARPQSAFSRASGPTTPTR